MFQSRLALAVLILAGVSITAVQAEETGPVSVPAEAQWFSLGSLKLASLHDAAYIIPNDGKILGVDARPGAVAKVLAKAGAPTQRIALSVNALLVKIPGHIVLIDAGLGSQAHGGMMESLVKAGVSADEVTDILITHTHGDHVGGLVTAEGKLAYPKAVVRMSAKEWAWMQSQSDAKAIVTAITPQIQVFEPGTQLLPGITPIAIKGHTPGHVGYEIVSGQSRLLDIGDTAHSSIISLADPDWIMGFDGDRALGRASRRATLAQLAKTHELVFSPHFPFPGVGKVAANGSTFTWQPMSTATKVAP
jgi:glyoxylase-like metal-dependent hydrolase (beta-lactamase superfamily II)